MMPIVIERVFSGLTRPAGWFALHIHSSSRTTGTFHRNVHRLCKLRTPAFDHLPAKNPAGAFSGN